MFYYVKMIGDEPIVIESEQEINKGTIHCNPKNLWFLMTMMTQQGQGMVPISAEDNGLENSEITIFGDSISLIAKLQNNSPIVDGINRARRAKLGIVTPEKKSIITP